MFKSALAGDFDPLFKTLHNREPRQQPVKELIEMRLQRYQNRTGAIQNVFARLTLPSDLDGREAAQTIVELKGEKGSFYFGLFWKDNKNIGIAPAMGVPNLSIPFLPVSSGQFAGYHLELGQGFQVRFQETEGKVVSLSVKTAEGPVVAKRTE